MNALFVLLGALGTALLGWMGKRTETKVEADRIAIEALKYELDSTREQLKSVREELRAVREEMRRIEEEARAERKEAYDLQDRNRMALSIAMAFIQKLREKIESTGATAPAVPEDLKLYTQAILRIPETAILPEQPPPIPPPVEEPTTH